MNNLTDTIFTKVNRLFVLSFENEEDRPYFSKYYVTKVEIKGFNVLIDGKSFLMCQWKAKRKHKKKLWALAKTMIKQLVIYWTVNTLQTLQTNCNRFKQTNSIRKSWFKATNWFYWQAWRW